jgi:hypothetical protein
MNPDPDQKKTIRIPNTASITRLSLITNTLASRQYPRRDKVRQNKHVLVSSLKYVPISNEMAKISAEHIVQQL